MAYPPPDDTPHPLYPACFYNADLDEYICVPDGNYFTDRTDYWTGGYGASQSATSGGGSGQGYYIPGAQDPSGRLRLPDNSNGGGGSRQSNQPPQPSMFAPTAAERSAGSIFGSPDGDSPQGFGLPFPNFALPSWLILAALGLVAVAVVSGGRRR